MRTLTGSAKVHRTPPPLSSLDEHLPNKSTSTTAAPAPPPRSASEHASDDPAIPPPMMSVPIECIEPHCSRRREGAHHFNRSPAAQGARAQDRAARLRAGEGH